MYEITFLKAAGELDCFSSGSTPHYEPYWDWIPFCNCPWVERVLVAIPNGCRLCLSILFGAS